MNPRSDLYALERRNISYFCRESKSDSAVVSPIAMSLYRLWVLSVVRVGLEGGDKINKEDK